MIDDKKEILEFKKDIEDILKILKGKTIANALCILEAVKGTILINAKNKNVLFNYYLKLNDYLQDQTKKHIENKK